MKQVIKDNEEWQEVILSEIPTNTYNNVLHISYGSSLLTQKLPGEKILGVDVAFDASSREQEYENGKLKLIQSSISSLVYQLQETFDLVVITDVLYPQCIQESYQFIYTVIDQLLLNDGILVCCHADEWYKARFPYLTLEYSLFENKQNTQRLEVYVK
ncbi:hypothetical protein [Fortiea contorta]|uniref:hypothetical protein n=1 Tax=Fortiea contorta TaxID=1892405 RepID=UPI0003627838|nr:hypothetical protein [Fortiea contorta]